MEHYQNEALSLVNAPMVEQKKSGTLYVVFGWLFCLISLLFIPILFGSAAFFMGFKTLENRSPLHGILIMFFAMIGMALGLLYSFFVAGTNFI